MVDHTWRKHEYPDIWDEEREERERRLEADWDKVTQAYRDHVDKDTTTVQHYHEWEIKLGNIYAVIKKGQVELMYSIDELSIYADQDYHVNQCIKKIDQLIASQGRGISQGRLL